METSVTFDLAVDAVLRMAGAADDDVDRAIVEILESLSGASGAERAYVIQFDAQGTFKNSHEWTEAGVIPHQPAIQNVMVADFPYSSGLAAKGKVMNIGRLDDLPFEGTNERVSFGAFGVSSVLQVPILVDSELVGVVGLNRFSSEGEWDSVSVDRVHLVGRAIGVALSRRAANARLKEALASAERASRAKDDLIARASHELRTPLHAILGFAELLDLDEAESEPLRQITTNGQLLLTMIDDLLSLGVSTDEPGEVASCEDLLTQVFASLDDVAERRNVVLRTEPGVEGANTDEAGSVRQVLHCVASTALTVAGDGGRVVAAVSAKNPTVVTFLCRGLNLRQPTGLALALATSFAERLGGFVSVSSEADAVLIDVVLGSP